MLFNSLNFAIFLPLLFLLYWFATKQNLRLQNTLLLVGSYFFYACWDWRFLLLLSFSTLLDYYSGLKIYGSNTQKFKKFWFWLSISINVSLLGVFKYYNFFAESFGEALANLGLQTNALTLQIILPVGISFYTFHGLSYIIDIYSNKIKAEKNFIYYALFVSFFLLLVAGPIERATHLLPQIKKKRVFDFTKAVDGLRQILWGLFKKIVIANQCAMYANEIFNNSTEQLGSTLVLGAVFFSFQIYGDFSGYSDIALGTARLFGIDLLRNFAFPYFSRDIAEFWRRWHISLTTWFKDYLYIPLGGSKGGIVSQIKNTFIVFIVSGFWHGANWTFIVWGILNAFYILPSIVFGTNRKHLETVAKGKLLPSVKDFFAILITFSLTVFAWIFFRATSLNHAIQIITQIFSNTILTIPTVLPKMLFVLLFIFIVVEWLGREEEYAIAKLGLKSSRIVKWSLYYSIILAIFYYSGSQQQFIYFQF